MSRAVVVRKWVNLTRDRRCSNRSCAVTLRVGDLALRVPACRWGSDGIARDVTVHYCQDCADQFNLTVDADDEDDD